MLRQFPIEAMKWLQGAMKPAWLVSLVTKPHYDAVTGDKLSTLEFVTRQVQACLRTPWFMAAYAAFTVVCACLGRMDFWNYVSSGLAIIIEWVVGTYFFGQTGRDAVYIRRIARKEDVLLADVEAIRATEEDDAAGLDAAQA